MAHLHHGRTTLHLRWPISLTNRSPPGSRRVAGWARGVASGELFLGGGGTRHGRGRHQVEGVEEQAQVTAAEGQGRRRVAALDPLQLLEEKRNVARPNVRAQGPGRLGPGHERLGHIVGCSPQPVQVLGRRVVPGEAHGQGARLRFHPTLHEADEYLPGIASIVQRSLDGGDVASQAIDAQMLEQGFLAGKAAIEGTDADPGAGGDARDWCPGILDEHCPRRVENALVVARRLGLPSAQPSFHRHRHSRPRQGLESYEYSARIIPNRNRMFCSVYLIPIDGAALVSTRKDEPVTDSHLDSTAIRPFTIAIPEADHEDLRDRLARSRWPTLPPDDDWSRGVPLPYLQSLAGYWRTGFDWRAQEARLNRYPQFVTEIDGQVIHFLHIRSAESRALPLILTHGWPSSFVEFVNLIGPLTDPVAHGGEAVDAFHVVIPSLPGFGFSTPLAGTGWGNLFRVAHVWAELMTRLGYERFAAHGTDVGSGVTGMLAMIAPERLVATHISGPVPFPFGPPIALDGLNDTDRVRAERFNHFQRDGLGYLHLQATRPQTLAYALTDSPIAQLAWIVEKFREWTDPAADLPEDAVDRDQLLTNVSITWFTCAGASSAHITYEGMQAYRAFVEEMAAASDDGSPEAPPAGPPQGVAVFAADNSIRDVIFPHGGIAHWAEYDRGGHFPAMETPDLLTADLRAFFRQVR